AKHPLVAAQAADAAADLAGQRLEGQLVVRGGQRAGEGVAGAGPALGGEEAVDGLIEAAPQQLLIAGEGDAAAAGKAGSKRQVKAVEGVEEEEGPDALVEVLTGPAELVEVGTLGQQCLDRRAPAKPVERLVAD